MGEINVPQPGGAYAWIEVNGELLNDPKKGKCNLMSFSYSRGNIGSANKAEFTLVDPEWDVLEKKLASAVQIKIIYGWVGGTLSNPIYLKLGKYRLQMKHDYVTIQVSAASQDPLMTQSMKPGGSSRSVGHVVQQSAFYMSGQQGKSPSDIIRTRLKAAGFDVSQVKDTEPFAEKHVDRNGTLAVTPPVRIPNQSPFRYIYDYLVPRSVIPRKNRPTAGDVKGEDYTDGGTSAGGYQVAVIDSDPPQIIYRPYFDESKIVERFQYPGRFGKGKENVISFEPSIDLSLLASAVGVEGQHGNLIDYVSSEVGTMDAVPDRREVDTPNGRMVLERKYFQGPNASPMSSDSEPTSNFKEASDRRSAFYGIAESMLFTAKLTIIGDPKFQYNNHVLVDVFKPDGSLHYTSGTYQVYEIIDTIDAGLFTTVLSLKKIDSEDMKKRRADSQKMVTQISENVKKAQKEQDKANRATLETDKKKT
jgi:hypothetical protein